MVTRGGLVVDAGVRNGKGDTYLVFESYVDRGNDAVWTNTWQPWDAIRAGQRSRGSTPPRVAGDRARLHLGSRRGDRAGRVLADFTHPTNGTTFRGNLGLKPGGFNHGLITAVDSLTVNGSTYDFGPRVFDPRHLPSAERDASAVVVAETALKGRSASAELDAGAASPLQPGGSTTGRGWSSSQPISLRHADAASPRLDA